MTRRAAWLRVVICLVIAAAFLVVLDLLFPLPEFIRRAAGIAWLICCVIALGHGAVAGVAVARRPAEFFARLLERGGPHAETVLINAVQFSRAAHAGGPMAASSSLMNAEIDRAGRIAEGIAPAACVDRTGLRRHGVALVVLVLVIAASGLTWPRVWAAVAPRFYDPGGDHPPFCRTHFDIRLASDSPDGRIAKGDNVKVVADLPGDEMPDQAWIIVHEADPATRPSRIDMFRRSDTQWTARFENVRQDMRFRVHVPYGYSKWQTITLAPVPQITEAVVQYAPPAADRRRPYERPLDRTGIRELSGTSVTLTIVADRPLRDGDVLLNGDGYDGKPRKMGTVYRSPNKVRTSFLLTNAGHLTATVTGVEGLKSRDRIEADLVPVAKQPPASGVEEGQAASVEEKLKDLVAELTKLATSMQRLAEQAAGREGELAASRPDERVSEATRKQLQSLAEDDRAMRQRAAELARAAEGAATSQPAGGGQATAGNDNGAGGEGDAELERSLGTLSKALKEAGDREGGRGLSESLRRDSVPNDEARRGLGRMLDDLKKDVEGLTGQACQGACKKIGESLAGRSAGGQAGTSSAAGPQGQGGGRGQTTAAPADAVGKPGANAVSEGKDAAGVPGPSTGQQGNGQSPPTESGYSTRGVAQAPAVAAERPAVAASVETITPDAPVAIDAGPIRGEQVPARYKDLTEAYFRRLAEENR